MTRSLKPLYLFVCLLFLAVGCSRAEVIPTPMPATETPIPTTAPTNTPWPTPVPTETPRPIVPTATAVLPTIAEHLSKDGRFSTLLTAFEQANLDDALGDPGPFTLFAPTNDAFATLPPGVLDTFLVDPKGDLSDLVLYHVVNGELASETLVDLTAVASTHGDNITIQPVQTSQIQLNQRVAVTTTDIFASNGVIHVIDSVLIPASTLGSLAEIASSDQQFTTFLAALEAAELTEVLTRDGPYTLLAPNDAAFANLPPGALASLLADPGGALTDTLFAHIINGQISSQDLAQLGELTDVRGATITISREDGAIVLNEDVQFTNNDILASNGVVHVVDSVLVPSLPTIAELLQLDPRFSQLVEALEMANLLDQLGQPGSQTLLAPTNEAFAALSGEEETAVSSDTRNILRYHLLDGLLSEDDLASSVELTTSNNNIITVQKTADSLTFNESASLNDIIYLASNGIIRGIDRVLLPPDES